MALLDEFTNDYERAQAFINLLIERATGSNPTEEEFTELRGYFIGDKKYSSNLPQWLISTRSLKQFWNFIQQKFGNYRQRREFLWSEFEPLLTYLESGQNSLAKSDVTEGLARFESEEVNRAWVRMIQRVDADPEGAITASRNLLETVLKHVLDDCNIEYDHDAVELAELYKKAAGELGLAPEQHQEQIFRQILGGCSGIVSGLGSLRNKLGDAHGKGRNRIRPSSRHARLAVNLAGGMALFVVETHLAKNASPPN